MVQLQSAEPVKGGLPPHWGPDGSGTPGPAKETPSMKRAVMSSEARG
jgi:hypothetical protein